MKWIRKKTLEGKVLGGVFLNLGSTMTAEIAGNAGLDWVLMDMEHGPGDHQVLLAQLQAVESTPAAALVRIAWNELPRFKRTLDLGPSGIMIPWINGPDEARQAVSSMRYPPQGTRGVAGSPRAAGFSRNFKQYFQEANENLLTVVQIETQEAVSNVEAIAAVEGVDVLFIGPLDLSVSLGMVGDFEHPDFRSALQKVASAARKAGKAAGILLRGPEDLERAVSEGFTFLGIGSDGGLIAQGMPRLAAAFDQYR